MLIVRNKKVGLILATVLVVLIIVGSFLLVNNSQPKDISCEDCNVVLIIVDTLRQDHLGTYGYFRDTSPNIDKLARESFVFDNAYSSSSWTRSAIASIVSSKSPSETQVYSENKNDFLDDSFYTMQEYYNYKGYKTAAFYTSAHLDYGLVQGFQETYPMYGGSKNNSSAEEVYFGVEQWIDNRADTDKFFLLVHLIDPHPPYDFVLGFNFTGTSIYTSPKKFFPPGQDGVGSCDSKENITVLKDWQLQEMEANYDGEIAYTDDQIGKFIGYLKEEGLYHKTIIIITSDHGEEFLDHGGYWHGCTLYNELIKIPFMVHIPGLKSRRFFENVGTIDIFPTLIDLQEPNSSQNYDLTGYSLLPLLNGKIKGIDWNTRPIFSATAFRGNLKYSLIFNGFKLVQYVDNKTIGLFDIDKDRGELNNLKIENQIEVYRNLLWNYIFGLDPAKNKDGGIELSQEALDSLKSLGYVA